MQLEGSRMLPVTQAQAWDALNDPQVLKACIPGCETLEPTADNTYAAALALKVGPVAARFQGRVALQDVRPPEGYRLVFEGQGGAAGFGKGQAQVRLAPQGEGCELRYSAHAQVGGKIAQVGQRLIDGVARSLAETFFERFERALRERHPAAAEPVAATEGPGQPEAARPRLLRRLWRAWLKKWHEARTTRWKTWT